MSNRQRMTLFVVLSATIVLLVYMVLVWNQPKEPVYQGKPLSYWVFANARPVDKDRPDPAAAIFATGTNAVPYLLKWAEQKPYTWQKKLRPYRDKSTFLRKIIPYSFTGIDKQNRALSALVAISRLGPAGRSAIPRLRVLANNSDNRVKQLASEALIALEASPGTVATNQNPKAQLNPIFFGMPSIESRTNGLPRCVDYRSFCALSIRIRVFIA
jgi:hypothetical protein